MGRRAWITQGQQDQRGKCPGTLGQVEPPECQGPTRSNPPTTPTEQVSTCTPLPASDQMHNKSIPTQSEESNHKALACKYQCSCLFNYRHNGQQLNFPPNTKQTVELNMDFCV